MSILPFSLFSVSFSSEFRKSDFVIFLLPFDIALTPASTTRDFSSAPLKPSVLEAISSRLILLDMGVFLVCTFRIESLPSSSGRGISTILSILPGLYKALSRSSGLFVAAIIFTSSSGANPSNSDRSCISVL